MMQFQTILNVCLGNICRSPMASGFFSKHYSNKHILSAGIEALVGNSVNAKAQQSMARLHQIDISSHIAQQINYELIHQADLILVMSNRQVYRLIERWPTVTGKVFRLGHWQSLDIVDPYGKSQLDFDQCSKIIENCVQDWIHRIN